MAWETGTATGHLDLLAKLKTFLTTNATLVAAGQQWEVLRDSNLPMAMPWPGRIAFYKPGSGSGGYPATMPDAPPAIGPAAGANLKIRFAGKLNCPSSGDYAFALLADDQLELRIDGVLIAGVYAANVANTFTQTGPSVTLSAGLHDIEVTHVQGGGNWGASIGWKKPGDSAFSIVPSGSYSAMDCAFGYADYVNPSAADMQAVLADRELSLKGPGLSGSDEIYVNFRTISSAQGDLYNVAVSYATGFDETQPLASQPGAGPNAFCLLWNQSIKYWFIANGRRFIVIAKVSTTYASVYGGLILPYGLPSEIPYPIAAGASCSANTRWSFQGTENSSFWNPGGGSNSAVSSLYMRRTDGSHDSFKNIMANQNPAYTVAWTYPYRGLFAFRPSPDNEYALWPVTLYSTANGGNVWGELDGVLAVSGYNNASENTITISGKTYLVVQSGYRTTASDYAAILLE